MGEYHQITISEWLDMKDMLRRELNNVRQSYVRVGYVLRRMEETRAYEAEGYKSVAEFAEREHGLKPSTTSRWMSINKEYSLGGYSETLDPRYIDMNASQLTEMLGLPMEDRELITPETKREDIRELKRLEKEQEAQGEFAEIVKAFLENNPDVMKELKEIMRGPGMSIAHCAEAVCPSGNRSYRNNGLMVFFYENQIKFKKAGQAPELRKWAEFIEIVEGIQLDEEQKEDSDGETEAEDREEKTGTGAPEDCRTEGIGDPGMEDKRRDEIGEEEEREDESGSEAGQEEPDEISETEDDGAAEELADERHVQTFEEVVPDINPPEIPDYEAEETSPEPIAPAQKSVDKPDKIIVNEDGTPSPEDENEDEEEAEIRRQRQIEEEKDSALLTMGELGDAIDEEDWKMARDKAKQLLGNLEWLAEKA